MPHIQPTNLRTGWPPFFLSSRSLTCYQFSFCSAGFARVRAGLPHGLVVFAYACGRPFFVLFASECGNLCILCTCSFLLSFLTSLLCIVFLFVLHPSTIIGTFSSSWRTNHVQQKNTQCCKPLPCFASHRPALAALGVWAGGRDSKRNRPVDQKDPVDLPIGAGQKAWGQKKWHAANSPLALRLGLVSRITIWEWKISLSPMQGHGRTLERPFFLLSCVCFFCSFDFAHAKGQRYVKPQHVSWYHTTQVNTDIPPRGHAHLHTKKSFVRLSFGSWPLQKSPKLHVRASTSVYRSFS